MLTEKLVRAILRVMIAGSRYWITQSKSRVGCEPFLDALTKAEHAANDYTSAAGA